MITAALQAMRGTAKIKLGYREYVLAILTLIFSVQYLDRFIVSLLAQPIKTEFGLSDSQMGLLTGFVFSIPYSVMLLPVGMLADRMNRRNLLAAAVAIWSCMTVLGGFVRTVWELMIVRGLLAAFESFNHPNALSMISDHYGRGSRATAVGLYYGGPSIGKVLGFTLIAYIAQTFGWRAGFFAAGIPGLFLSAALFLTVREPRREGHDHGAGKVVPPRLGETFSYVWKQRSVLHLTLAMTLTSIIASGYIAWMAPFLMRSYGMSLTDVALVISFVYGGSTALGHAVGGVFVDRLGRGSVTWYALAPAGFCILALIFMIGTSLSPRALPAMIMIALWAIPMGCLYGPVMGTIHSLVLPKMRGIVTSSFSISINLIGAGIGPLLVGALSDAYSSWLGPRSLQIALATASLSLVWAMLHFLLAARTLTADMARSEAASPNPSAAP